MANIEIISVNCQGLHDKNKRFDVLSYLKNMNYDIYCLQDTHFTEKLENEIQNFWGSNCLFSSYNSNSRGVAILFNKNLDYKILKHKIDSNGNILTVQLQIDSYIITLINIYGPNNDMPQFYNEVEQLMEDFDSEEYIVCGDFNLILDPDLDCFNYARVNNPKARDRVIELQSNKNMLDSYRELHPHTKRYTWRKKSPLKQSRLDYIFISETLLPCLMKASILPSYRSDHSATHISLKLNQFTKGRGLWKFNNSLLKDTQYLELVNSTIENTLKEYTVPVYNHENIMNIDKQNIVLTINDQLFLETLLMNIRGNSISYSSHKKKETDKLEKKLIDEIQDIEYFLDENKIEI